MTKLYPSCSEYICRLGIKKEELPYIKKRLKELIKDKKEQKGFLKSEFLAWVDKDDEQGFGSFISTGDDVIYNKIKDELLGKREGLCPFCKEIKENLSEHIKKFHLEEIKNVLRYINKEEYEKIRKELVLDNL